MNGPFRAAYLRRVWQQRLDRLEAYLRYLNDQGRGTDNGAGPS